MVQRPSRMVSEHVHLPRVFQFKFGDRDLLDFFTEPCRVPLFVKVSESSRGLRLTGRVQEARQPAAAMPATIPKLNLSRLTADEEARDSQRSGEWCARCSRCSQLGLCNRGAFVLCGVWIMITLRRGELAETTSKPVPRVQCGVTGRATHSSSYLER